MMVSLSNLFTFISLFSAVFVAAKDADSQKPESVDSKFWGAYPIVYTAGWPLQPAAYRRSWFYSYYNLNRNVYSWAYSRYNGNSNYYRYWFKSEGSKQQRRAIQIRSESPQPATGPAAQGNIQCKNAEGKTAVFNAYDCQQAAGKLVSEHSSKSVHGTCALSIVGPEGPLVAAGVTTSELQTIAQNMLKACTAGASHSQSKRAPAETSGGTSERGSFAMLLTEAH